MVWKGVVFVLQFILNIYISFCGWKGVLHRGIEDEAMESLKVSSGDAEEKWKLFWDPHSSM